MYAHCFNLRLGSPSSFSNTLFSNRQLPLLESLICSKPKDHLHWASGMRCAWLCQAAQFKLTIMCITCSWRVQEIYKTFENVLQHLLSDKANLALMTIESLSKNLMICRESTIMGLGTHSQATTVKHPTSLLHHSLSSVISKSSKFVSVNEEETDWQDLYMPPLMHSLTKICSIRPTCLWKIFNQ